MPDTPTRSVFSSLARRIARHEALEEGPDQKAEVKERLLDETLRRAQTGILVLIVVLVLLRSVVSHAFDSSRAVRLAFLWTVAVALLRWGFVMLSRWRRSRRAGAVPWSANAFLALTALTGLGLGAINVFSYPHLDDVHVALLGATQIALCAAAVSVLTGNIASFLAFAAPNLGSLAALIALEARPAFGWALPVLTLFALPALIVMALQVRAAHRRSILLELQLADLVLRDGLTHLRNRRFLSEFMSHEVVRTLGAWATEGPRRTPPPRGSIGLLVLDVDRFKEINDEYGHAAGDGVLLHVVAVLQHVVRAPDLLVRWGGEEFVVIARDTEREALARLAERLRKAVEESSATVPSGDEVRRTVSIGCAAFPFRTEDPAFLTWEQTLAVADHALLVAKKKGRNRVVSVLPGAEQWSDRDRVVAALEKDFPRALEEGYVRLA